MGGDGEGMNGRGLNRGDGGGMRGGSGGDNYGGGINDGGGMGIGSGGGMDGGGGLNHGGGLVGEEGNNTSRPSARNSNSSGIGSSRSTSGQNRSSSSSRSNTVVRPGSKRIIFYFFYLFTVIFSPSVTIIKLSDAGRNGGQGNQERFVTTTRGGNQGSNVDIVSGMRNMSVSGGGELFLFCVATFELQYLLS